MAPSLQSLDKQPRMRFTSAILTCGQRLHEPPLSPIPGTHAPYSSHQAAQTLGPAALNAVCCPQYTLIIHFTGQVDMHAFENSLTFKLFKVGGAVEVDKKIWTTEQALTIDASISCQNLEPGSIY